MQKVNDHLQYIPNHIRNDSCFCYFVKSTKKHQREKLGECLYFVCMRTFFLTYHLFHNLGIAVITSYYHLMVMIILPWLFFSLVARKLTKFSLPQRKVRPEKLQILVTISCIVTMRCEVRPVHVDPAPHPGVAPVRRSWWCHHGGNIAPE